MTHTQYIGDPRQLPPVRKQTPVRFNTPAGNSTPPGDMDYYAGYTGNYSFTLWFQTDGVEYNVSPHYRTGYTYASPYPLPIHHAIIKHYGLRDQIKKWNETHGQS